jgi:hypothetical protein
MARSDTGGTVAEEQFWLDSIWFLKDRTLSTSTAWTVSRHDRALPIFDMLLSRAALIVEQRHPLRRPGHVCPPWMDPCFSPAFGAGFADRYAKSTLTCRQAVAAIPFCSA